MPHPVGVCFTSGYGFKVSFMRELDRFGNRWQQNGPIASSMQFTGNNPPSPANTNRIDGYSYDTAGNMTGDGIHTFTYDAENRLIAVTGGGVNSTYSYDALGRRVEKTGDVNECGYDGTIYYLYDLSDRAVVRYPDSGTNNCHDEVYAGGRHLATYAQGLTFSHSDWLGTERVRHGVGSTFSETCASLPFGDNLKCNTTGDPGLAFSPLHFTGKEHDAESGLDDFGARYYTSALGRFMIPDWDARPITVPYAQFGDPQSLNLYTLVRNDPVTEVDADGHRGGVDPGTNCSTIGACDEGSEFPESAKQPAQQQQPDQLQQVVQAGAEKKQQAIDDVNKPATDEGRMNSAKQATQMAEPMINTGVKVVAVEAGVVTIVAVATSATAAEATHATAQAARAGAREATAQVLTNGTGAQAARGAFEALVPGSGRPSTPVESVAYVVVKVLKSLGGF